jgi:retinol dehydrogenase-12
VAHNAKVYLAARSKERAQTAIDDICKTTGKSDIHFLQLDLSDLPSVKKAAEEYTSKEQELHVLINNA